RAAAGRGQVVRFRGVGLGRRRPHAPASRRVRGRITRHATALALYYLSFLMSGIGSRMTVTAVSLAGMRSVQASNSSSAFLSELLIDKSSMAVSKLETQITSPSLARYVL